MSTLSKLANPNLQRVPTQLSPWMAFNLNNLPFVLRCFELPNSASYETRGIWNEFRMAISAVRYAQPATCETLAERIWWKRSAIRNRTKEPTFTKSSRQTVYEDESPWFSSNLSGNRMPWMLMRMNRHRYRVLHHPAAHEAGVSKGSQLKRVDPSFVLGFTEEKDYPPHTVSCPLRNPCR